MALLNAFEKEAFVRSVRGDFLLCNNGVAGFVAKIPLFSIFAVKVYNYVHDPRARARVSGIDIDTFWMFLTSHVGLVFTKAEGRRPTSGHPLRAYRSGTGENHSRKRSMEELREA